MKTPYFPHYAYHRTLLSIFKLCIINQSKINYKLHEYLCDRELTRLYYEMDEMQRRAVVLPRLNFEIFSRRDAEGTEDLGILGI
jgi:hypothetical protein